MGKGHEGGQDGCDQKGGDIYDDETVLCLDDGGEYASLRMG